MLYYPGEYWDARGGARGRQTMLEMALSLWNAVELGKNEIDIKADVQKFNNSAWYMISTSNQFGLKNGKLTKLKGSQNYSPWEKIG